MTLRQKCQLSILIHYKLVEIRVIISTTSIHASRTSNDTPGEVKRTRRSLIFTKATEFARNVQNVDIASKSPNIFDRNAQQNFLNQRNSRFFKRKRFCLNCFSLPAYMLFRLNISCYSEVYFLGNWF